MAEPFRKRWNSEVEQQRINKPIDLSFWRGLHNAGRSSNNLKHAIESGPFRQFYECARRMDFKSICFPGNGVLRVLGAEVIVDKQSNDEMWFLAGGVPHRFGKQEFALVTGLKFGPIDINIEELDNEPLREDSVVRRLFPNARNMKVNGDDVDVLLFSQLRRLAEDDAEKLMYVLVVHIFLMGNPMGKGVDTFLWYLVDDIERFRGFPWGSYLLHETIKDLRKKLGGSFFSNPTRGVHLQCFGLAFLWWMVEAFPDVRVASRVTKFERDKEDENLYPRCMNWNFEDSSSKRFDMILREVGNPILVPTEAERNSWYMTGFQVQEAVDFKVEHESDCDSETNLQEFVIRSRNSKGEMNQRWNEMEKRMKEMEKTIIDLQQWRSDIEGKKKASDSSEAGHVKKISVRPVSIKEATSNKKSPFSSNRKKRKAPDGEAVLGAIQRTRMKTRRMVQAEMQEREEVNKKNKGRGIRKKVSKEEEVEIVGNADQEKRGVIDSTSTDEKKQQAVETATVEESETVGSPTKDLAMVIASPSKVKKNQETGAAVSPIKEKKRLSASPSKEKKGVMGSPTKESKGVMTRRMIKEQKGGSPVKDLDKKKVDIANGNDKIIACVLERLAEYDEVEKSDVDKTDESNTTDPSILLA